METEVTILGKTVKVYLSQSAERAISKREKPLFAEMELYFSCLIRFKVRFYENQAHGEGVNVVDKLVLSFRPVMTAYCGSDYEGDEPPLTDFPIENGAAFVPKWVRVDYRRNQWVGEFGMTAKG